MKQRKRRIIRSLELDEISAVGTPAQAGALHAITKSQPAEFPTTADTIEVLKNASPEALEIFKSQIESQRKWLENFQNPNKEIHKMTDIPSDYDALCNHYADKWDVTPAAAGVRLMQDRPDLVAKAYETEQAAYVQRQIDARNKVYGE